MNIIKDSIDFDGVDSSGRRTATRYLVIDRASDDSTMDLAESNLLPQIGDAHPQYTNYICDSVDKPTWGEGGEPRFFVKVKYRRGGSRGGGGGSQGGDVPPWELGPQDVTTTAVEVEYQMDRLYSPEKKKWIWLKNSAGNRLIKTGRTYIVQLSFIQNYEHKTGRWKEAMVNQSINSEQIKVCNLNIGPYCGKLLPFTPKLHTVYENDGETIKYEYESVQYTIEILTNGDVSWKEKILNVGKYARFPLNGGTLSPASPIFSYQPIVSDDATANLAVKTRYGRIEDVMAAQTAYEKATNNKGKKIPYAEITEELPLKADGTLYLEAMEDPENYEYLTIEGFPVVPESWTKYDLPEEV